MAWIIYREGITTQYHGEILISDDIIPVRKNQAYEELLQKERELAAALYMEKDRQGRNL